MNTSFPLPSVAELKAQARRLRTTLENTGQSVGHSRSLELIAHQMGYRDWNTLHAAAGNRGGVHSLAIGTRVSGAYLGKEFDGEVIAIERLSSPGLSRVTVRFDEPVDVVRFESFSSLRQRVTCVLDADGVSPRRTGDGEPHMRLTF